jgi:hypothetical protein
MVEAYTLRRGNVAFLQDLRIAVYHVFCESSSDSILNQRKQTMPTDLREAGREKSIQSTIIYLIFNAAQQFVFKAPVDDGFSG